MAKLLIPGIDPDADAIFRKARDLGPDDPAPVSIESYTLPRNYARNLELQRHAKVKAPLRMAEPPLPGWSKEKLDKTLDASVDRENFRRRDFFAVSPFDKRVELFKKSIPGARNDVKAHIPGGEASGNFLFGAEAAAAGLGETEALLWGQGAQIAQDAMQGKWPSWSDNPGDEARIKDGYRYFGQRYFDPSKNR